MNLNPHAIPKPGSLALRAVDAAVDSRWPAAVSRASASTDLERDQRVRQATRSFARELAVVGAAAGGTAAVPGVGTGVAVAVSAGEFTVSITRTADLILTIGAIHGLTNASIEERRAWVLSILLFGDSASKGFTKLAGELGKGLGSKATAAIPTETLKAINKTLGRTILTKYGTKRGVIAIGRVLPFGIGAAVGGTANLVLTLAIGRHAATFFADLPEALRHDAPDPALRSSMIIAVNELTPSGGAVVDQTESINPQDVEQPAARLDRVLTPLLLDPQRVFVCASEDLCRDSAKARNFGFAAGQLSYVGDAYGIHKPAVLVVSMQVGDAEAPITMAQRSDQIRSRIDEAPGQRNPHMRGTTRALQIIHGLSPDSQSERLADGTHVLDTYAMANSVLCSALPTGGSSRRGKPTTTMLDNCGRHLAITIEALAPSIIVSQGSDTAQVIQGLATEVETISATMSRITIGDTDAIWCSLSHPAAGPPSSWSSPKPGSYFDTVVRPTLKSARVLAQQREL